MANTIICCFLTEGSYIIGKEEDGRFHSNFYCASLSHQRIKKKSSSKARIQGRWNRWIFPPPPPFFWDPFFLFCFLSLKYWLVLIHYYKNLPPISKSWIRACSQQTALNTAQEPKWPLSTLEIYKKLLPRLSMFSAKSLHLSEWHICIICPLTISRFYASHAYPRLKNRLYLILWF